MRKQDTLIDERSRKLLTLLIENYIREGLPVSSKTLTNEIDCNMSSATVRNIMADLETAGFLHSPHTSSGRVPTVKGYRFFVDGLLKARTINEFDFSNLAPKLKTCMEIKELVGVTSALLSNMTRFASIVMLPRRNLTILKQVEFLLLSANRILVILILNQNEIQNRVIHTEKIYKANELKRAANYINCNFSGLEFKTIRSKLLKAMRDDRRNMESILELVINTAENAFAILPEKEKDNYILAGEEHLLDLVEKNSISRLRDLFAAFTQKQDILYLLDRSLRATGIKIYIGEESGYKALDSHSLVTATYSVRDEIIGVLGVIGPTRMKYDQAITAVDMTAKLLGKVLAERVD